MPSLAPLASSWSDPVVLPTLFHFPEGVTPPHFVSRLVIADWRDKLEWRDGRLFWKEPIEPYYGLDDKVELPQRNTIMLHQQWLRFSREEGTIKVAGRPLELKPKPTTRTSIPFEHGALYRTLVRAVPPPRAQ